MNWQRYINELIVLGAFLLLLGAFFYKNTALNAQANAGSKSKESIAQIQETVALKEIWADKKTSKKLAKIPKLVSASKVKWRKKGKKIEAKFQNLTARELNNIVSKIFNLAVEIKQLKIQKKALLYDMEFKCKW